MLPFMSWPYPPEPALATDRFTMIVSALVGYIRTKAKPGTLWSLVYLAAARVTRIQKRFERLVVRYRAGTLPPPRAPRPEKQAPETDAEETGAKPARPASLLPRHRGWLCAMVPLWAAGYGGKILYLLDHPEMRELIAAAPQAGRLIRPLLWMTGRPIPEFLRLPPRERAPRPRPAKPDTAPTDLAKTKTARPRRPRRSAATAPGAAAPAPAAAADAMPAGAMPAGAMPAGAAPTPASPPVRRRRRTARPPEAGPVIFRGSGA